MSVRLFVSAGEASGDRHAAALVHALRRRIPDLEIRGLGGPALEAEGATLLARIDELSALGFSEVIRRLPFFAGLLHRVSREISEWKPHLVLPVDYPGFNLRMAGRARARGVRVLYYIAPQVWAWRAERRPGIARAVDHLLVVFPFEEALFREAGIATTFVGHPLLDAAPGPGARRCVVISACPWKRAFWRFFPGAGPRRWRRSFPPWWRGRSAPRREPEPGWW